MNSTNDIDPTEPGTISIMTLRTVGESAAMYAQAVAETVRCKLALKAGYQAWRQGTGNYGVCIERGDAAWRAMMAATEVEYQAQERAKTRERRAKAKLLRVVGVQP